MGNLPTINNSQVTCIVHNKPGCLVEFEATVSKEAMDSAHAKAIKLLGKNLSIPGFRKGKVPESFVLQRFPKELQDQWQECVVHVALQESFKQTGIQPLNKDDVGFKVKSFSPDEASISFTFEVAPTIPHVDPTLFKLQEVKKPVVDEKKIKETIRQTLFFYATWNPIEGKAVEEGDFLMLDVDLMESTPPSALFTNTRFEVTEESMAKWMRDILVGAKVGDVVEGVSVPDDSADPLEKETMKPQKVRITIKAMEVPVLPEMTPELFKNLGVESEEDLKAKVEKLLNDQASAHVKEEERVQVREFLLREFPFDLPTTLINNEVQFRITQLNKSGEFLQHWRTLDQEGQKKMIEMIKSQSEKAVKLFHLSNQLLQDKNLSPSALSLPKAAETQLEALINPDQEGDYREQPELRRAEALSKLILEQAEDYVIAQATGNVVG